MEWILVLNAPSLVAQRRETVPLPRRSALQEGSVEGNSDAELIGSQ